MRKIRTKGFLCVLCTTTHPQNPSASEDKGMSAVKIPFNLGIAVSPCNLATEWKKFEFRRPTWMTDT